MIELALTSHGKTKVPHSSLRPCSPECPHRPLRVGPQPHRCVDDHVIKASVIVQVHRQDVRMSMALERITLRIPAGQLGAIHLAPTTRSGDEASMQQFGLRQNAFTVGRADLVPLGVVSANNIMPTRS